MYSGGYVGGFNIVSCTVMSESHTPYARSGYHVGIFTVDPDAYSNLLALYHLLQWGVEEFLNERK